ncbi:ATP-binding protein [Micromonospora purpureochromogenes]|uniref:ATPase/transcriptional regulator with XRE-family HTH domain n=1 Tax=Micromonospora purpureochromogenes TaxID=47872 RepID=A0ABX2RLP2_9ACTN|nr:helix-turn-helix domain-containing protein [Micromonospora purpureochromogenes]NYF56113.1 putative ATPase/transcriptional regulator with XRE-family HTH domain [Micromonospora purpureochromogenes]
MTPAHDHQLAPGGRTPLAELLRGHRLRAGLTQAELAQRAGIGVRTVRDLERGRSSRPQRTTVELLADALGLTDGPRAAFLTTARGRVTVPAVAADPGRAPAAGSAPREPDPSGTPIALPPPVELIGRERDLADLAALLTTDHWPPVVTLVGLAGVGKTALALAVAHEVVAAYPGGVAGVLVGEGSDAADVLAAMSAVLGAARLPDLAVRLRNRPALLLVDAAERAPDPLAEALRQLTDAVPSLRVLVTGRHPVGVPGELVRPVAPLDVPPADAVDAADLARYPAAALFAARLARVRPEPPDPRELPALAALVRRLGGLPLAIELMAARGRILDLDELLDRYGDRVLDLASPDLGRRGWEAAEPAGSGRARAAVAVTLREAVATSYRLLADAERAAVRRLSAFANRWSVELAEELLADGADRDGAVVVDPVPLLDRLVELGLLSVRGAGPFRFRLLDAVRDFAVERAAGLGELTAIRRRHAVVVARLVTRTAPDLVGAKLPAAVRQLDEATSDISAALAHAATDDPLTALRLAAALTRWWRLRGRDVSGRQWLRRLLADPRTADADPVLRAWALLGVARLAAEHGAGAQELPAARAALDVFAAHGEITGELEARTVLCALLVAIGEHDEAREQAQAVLTLATRHGRVRDMAVAQNNLTWHEIRLGDLTGARRRLAIVDRLAAQCDERRLRLLARANLADVARLEGRYAEAVEQGRRVAGALADLGDPGHRRRVLGTVGLALARDGRLDEAVDVLAELRSEARPVPLGSGPAVPVDGPLAAASVPRRDVVASGSALPDGLVPARSGPVSSVAVVPSPSGSGRLGWPVGQGRAGTAVATPQPEEGIVALIEGTVALHRGDRELAAEWFGAAVEAGVDGQYRRDVVEALVGLAASTDDPVVLDRLDRACRESGIRLLPYEQDLLRGLRPVG